MVGINISLNLGSRLGGILGAVGDVADFVVSNNTEWDNTMALGAAALSGKRIDITGPLDNISIPSFTAPAELVTVTSSGAGSVNRLKFNTLSNFKFSNKFQMTGWPADYEYFVEPSTGTIENVSFEGATFRHGYGPTHENFVTDSEAYPENERQDNLFTATTTSTANALTWRDDTVGGGSLYIFNNGSERIYYAVGGAGVTATTAGSDPFVEPGSSVRLFLDPAVDTHAALVTAAGTSDVNARTEVGMTRYLASVFGGAGGCEVTGDFVIKNCVFEDLRNAVKGLPGIVSGQIVVWGNECNRIFQDCIAFGFRDGGRASVIGNILTVPFSRSGVAQNLSGDAEDPHGDLVQFFSGGIEPTNNPIGPMSVYGNLTRVPPLRVGASAQGLFASDSNHNPSYIDVRSAGNMWIGGSGNGISCGEPGLPVENLVSYGDVVVSWEDLDENTKISTLSDNNGDVAVVQSIAELIFSNGSGQTGLSNALVLGDTPAIDRPALMPNYADRYTAVTRAEMIAAWTSSVPDVGLTAVQSLIDYDATTVEGFFDIDAAHPCVAWADVNNQPISTLTALGPRKVMMGGTGQAVVPSAGVEVRILSDRTTVVTDWTSASTTVDRDQWIDIRGTTSANSLTATPFLVSVNGYDIGATVTSELVLNNPFVLNNAAFEDTASAGEGITQFEFEILGKFPTALPGLKVFGLQVSGITFRINVDDEGDLYRVAVEDGDQVLRLNSLDLAPDITGNLFPDQAFDIRLVIDWVGETAQLTVNGATGTENFETPATANFMQTGRKINFNGLTTTSTSTQLPTDTQIESVRFYKTIAGTRTLHKEISIAAQGSIAGINSDPWIASGTSVTAMV